MVLDIGMNQVKYGNIVERYLFSIPWFIGIIIYIIGVLISLFTGDLTRFLRDYPWALFSITIMIGAWANPSFYKRHMNCTRSIRNIFSVSDETFETIFEDNMRNLKHPRNLIFGLIFLPALLWAWTQHLWWQGYNNSLIFDVYYLLVLAFIFINYAGLMFGAVISCNLNVYRLCEKIPIDYEYVVNEGQSLLRGLWGGLVGRATAVALILSALTNVPIIIYSGSMSLFLNLAIAMVLTILIFIVPHYMFHRLLERAKEEMLSKVLSIRRKLSLDSIEDLGRGTDDQRNIGDMLELIYLTQYEGDLRGRSTWLVDLEVVVELLVVGSIHVIFMEILTMFVGH